MSSRLTAVVLAVVLLANPLTGQQVAPTRARQMLARAESLRTVMKTEDRARESVDSARHVGRVTRTPHVTLVAWQAVASDLTRAVATRADSMLAAFGAIPDSFLSSVTVMQLHVSDSIRVLAVAGLRGRRILPLEWFGNPDTAASAERVTAVIGRAYRLQTDKDWREWLPDDPGIEWRREREGEWALRALTERAWLTGAGCLAGATHDCREWLGVDRDSTPYASRYHPEELAARARSYVDYSYGRDTWKATAARCGQGDHDACLGLAEAGHLVPLIPAGDIVRASLVRAVLARHGAAALGNAFRDTTGSVGSRLARAAGISEDSLMQEWRAWTLARGRTERLQADTGQVFMVLFAAMVVVFAATRSGRWR